MAKQHVEFIRNGERITLTDIGPTDSLLDYLRLTEGACGTKEGCAEGDCGACTVVLGRQIDGKVEYRPVNSCIYFMGMVDGQEVISVDDLAADSKALHPIQQAMVDKDGSQCGFCTPGFVMALFALYHQDNKVNRPMITDQLAGNLCRCTGYRPIIEAGLSACNGKAEDQFTTNMTQTAKLLSDMPNNDLFIGDEKRFFAAPKTLDSLVKLYEQHPDATIVAGATDVGLWVTKRMMELPKIIYIGEVADLNLIKDEAEQITLGAAVTYSAAESALASLDEDIAETVRRIGAKQVRETGTIGGNIANGSPIGDMPPILIAMGADIELQSQAGIRRLKLEDYFIAYGKQNRLKGEILSKIVIPKLKTNEHFRCFKISKRFDQDISAVMAAFHFTINDGIITNTRIAFGGMAATPKRAKLTEAALIGKTISNICQNDDPIKMLSEDFTPLSDMRASAAYRSQVAKGLLAKAIIEIAHNIAGEREPSMRIIAQRASSA